MLLKTNEAFIIILGRSQLLKFYHQGITETYHISTAKNGYGEVFNSYKTPRGWHYIRAIVGRDNPENTFYKSRRPTTNSQHISGRILWLCGLEPHNHSPLQHSMKRYIYIHGTIQSFKKKPQSHGCINMRNQDIIKLTKRLPKYCKVLIDPEE